MFPEVIINWWAVFAAVILNLILGKVWYGPLFGKTPVQGVEQGPKPAAWKPAVITVLAALLMVWVMAYMIDYTLATTWLEGAQTGFWLWAGFQLTLIAKTALYERKDKKAMLIKAGYQLIALCATGALLAAWA